MKVAKIKKQAQKENINSVETYSLKSMIKILISLLVIFGIFYFITVLLIDNRKEEDSNSSPAVIDSSKITLSQLLNRKEEEYYVIATQESLYESSYIETNYIEFYNNYINSYKQEENSIAFYYVDLDSALNKKFLGEELNITNNIQELKLNDEILFKIVDGKIENYYVGKDEILDKLSEL